MKKTKFVTVRFDERTMLQIDELSELLGVSKSIVVRMLCRRTINEMQDRYGNWNIAKGADKAEDA